LSKLIYFQVPLFFLKFLFVLFWLFQPKLPLLRVQGLLICSNFMYSFYYSSKNWSNPKVLPTVDTFLVWFSCDLFSDHQTLFSKHIFTHWNFQEWSSKSLHNPHMLLVSNPTLLSVSHFIVEKSSISYRIKRFVLLEFIDQWSECLWCWNFEWIWG